MSLQELVEGDSETGSPALADGAECLGVVQDDVPADPFRVGGKLARQLPGGVQRVDEQQIGLGDRDRSHVRLMKPKLDPRLRRGRGNRVDFRAAREVVADQRLRKRRQPRGSRHPAAHAELGDVRASPPQIAAIFDMLSKIGTLGAGVLEQPIDRSTPGLHRAAAVIDRIV